METFKTNLKNLSKNKFHLMIIGLIAIIFATVLIYAYVEYSGTKVSFLPIESPTEKGKCGIENCHGLNITCGQNIPNVCTAIYMIGDGCRKYAECEIINGKCQLVQNKKFEDCKSCVEKCSEDFENDPINLSQCAYKCAEAEEEGCYSNKDCGGNQFCEFPEGECKGSGKCIKKSEFCTMIYSPVCGCDSKTYSNDCMRQSAGVSKKHNGKCGEEKQTCNEKCKSLGYESGICRTWPVVPNVEWRCKEGEKNIGETSDCTLVRTIGEVDRVIVGVGKTCCCQEKISENCTEEGESVPVVPGALKCCEGLTKISCAKPDANGICSEGCLGASICANCGNGICGPGENKCNCPEDCKEEQSCQDNFDCPEKMKCENNVCISVGCVKEGNHLPGAISPDYLKHIATECCAGLESIEYAGNYDENCNVAHLDGGPSGTCANCGNGICGLGENKCNCPEDCKKEIKYNLDEYYSNIDYSCNTDSDCEIKDIRNCCGYYPKCVNKNTEVDSDYVSKACVAGGISSVCGFPSIDSCKCIQNKCEGFLKEEKKEEETLSADLNCDSKINLTDAAILMSFWNKDPSGAVSCQSPDINQDGKVNLTDSAIMMSQWETGQEIINCGEDYDCLYQQISDGKSAKVIITEEIKSLSLIEKSEVKVEPVNNKYQVSMKVLDLKEIKKEKFSIRSIVGSISKTCPQIVNNLDKIKSKSATCVVDSAKKAKQLAIDGLTENAIKNYNCEGDLIDAINEICATPDFPHFPPGVRKPAVYLYPTVKSEIEVNLSINGFITKSEPDYLLGWNVTAEPNGLIDNEYDYLFYEAQLNNLELPDKGWVVEYSNLENWFGKNLPQLGLNQKEISQFKEYWLSELKESNYYEIKLLDEKFLTENMNLIINPQPDTIIRRNFYFKPLNEKITLTEPIISAPERIGFTAVEWGGLFDE